MLIKPIANIGGWKTEDHEALTEQDLLQMVDEQLPTQPPEQAEPVKFSHESDPDNLSTGVWLLRKMPDGSLLGSWNDGMPDCLPDEMDEDDYAEKARVDDELEQMMGEQDEFTPKVYLKRHKGRRRSKEPKQHRLHVNSVVNRVRIEEFERKVSTLARGFRWLTGIVTVECLDCGKYFDVKRHRLKYSNWPKSVYNCGCLPMPACVRKPPKPYAISNVLKAARGRNGGMTPAPEFVGTVWGKLTAVGFVRAAGWVCKCKCGQQVTVRYRTKLTSGAITGCPTCDERGWSGKAGRRPKGGNAK